MRTFAHKLGLLFIITLIVVCTDHRTASAQFIDTIPCPVTWGPTVQISNTAGSAFVPKIAVVGDTVHVIYSAGDIYYRRSTDSGRTWGQQIVLVPVDSINPQIWNRPFAASGPNVYFVWANRASPSGDERGIKVRRSTDGGATWLDPEYVLFNQPPLLVWSVRVLAAHGQDMYLAANRYVAGYMHTFLVRSHNGGATWDSLRQITFGTQGYGSWDIAASSRGVHIVYEQDVQPSRREVGQLYSTDRGETWSAGEILSTIDAYRGWEPQVAADDSGNVYCCWQDAKYGTVGGFDGTLLLRRSHDDGLTWLPEQILGSLPSVERSAITVFGSYVHAAWQDNRFGSLNPRVYYSGSTNKGVTWCDEFMVADSSQPSLDATIAAAGNKVHGAWSFRIGGGTAQVFSRMGEARTTSVRELSQPSASQMCLNQNYPNPFNLQTTIAFRLEKPEEIRLSVIDLLGRELVVLLEGKREAGIHYVQFSAVSYPTGMYFVLLQTEGRKEVKPILLLK